MTTRKKWALCLAILALAAIPTVMGCNFLQYQFCIYNGTSYILKEVDIVFDGSDSWGSNVLTDGTPLDPGASQDIKGYAPGSYWVRAIFDVVDPLGNDFCEDTSKSFQQVDQNSNEVFVYSYDLDPITTTNLCLDYLEQQDLLNQKGGGPTCTEIYADAHFEI